MKLKLVSMMMAFFMAAGSAAGLAGPLQAQAATVQENADSLSETNEQGDCRYQELADGTIGITRYTGTDAHLVIPREIDGKKVTRIEDASFSECSSLQSVEIPEGVTSLPDYVFCFCENLKKVTFPKGITYIGEHAFLGCKSLKSVKLPSSVKSIGWDAFAGCSSLTDVQLSKNLETIDMEAFSGCKALKSISIPENVWRIGESVFAGCGSLQSIRLPKSMKEIAESAFAGCGKLKDVYYAGSKAARKKVSITGSGNENLMNAKIHYGNAARSELLAPKKGVVVKSGQDSYKVKTKVSTVTFIKTTRRDSRLTIPEYVQIDGIVYDVVSVTANALKNNKKLSKLTIQGDISTIGAKAFSGCSRLKNVVIRSRALKSVGTDAWKGTPADIKIKVPSGEASHYKKLLKGKGIGSKAVIVEL